MSKGFYVALVIMLTVLAAPMSAQALLFNATSQPGVADNWIDVSSWDWTQDNALAVDSVPLSGDFNNPTEFDLYYQASLGSYLDSSNNTILNTGLGSDYEITLVAGITEEGYNFPVGANKAGADFEYVAGGVSYFEMYLDTSLDSNTLAGTGYDNGTSLMTGVVDSSSGNFTVTLFDGSGSGEILIESLDQFNANDYPDVYTLEGIGSTKLEASSDFVNGDYFEALAVGFYLELFFNTSTITPFQQADPAAQVEGITPQFGLYNSPTLGWVTVNGLPDFTGTNLSVDFLFQADGNSSITVVPEPSTIILLGAGLIGLVGLRGVRGRKKD